MRRLAVTVLLAACAAPATTAGTTAAPTRPASTTTTTTTATAPCAPVPLRTQLAQLLLVGFPNTRVGEEERALLRESVGGVVLFRWNVESKDQVRDLVASLQRESPTPLEVAVDEEPGRIARLAGVITEAPAARTLGQQDAATMRDYGSRM